MTPERLSAEFAARISPPIPRERPLGDLIGLEHEYVVHGRDAVLDFRQLIRELAIDGRALDPGDVNAHRCTWGGVITADGYEAEVAIPPLRRRPGFVTHLERYAERARDALRRALPNGLDLAGYSTHISVSVPAAVNEAACRLFLSTFAPGLMLLADGAGSPGLLVRPRPGRMELAAEYVRGEHLRAVSAFSAGAAVASARAARGERVPLPPRLGAAAIETSDRYGWGLPPTAFGEDDLLRKGRAALLRRESGRTIRAQDHLELAWAAARSAIADACAPADLRAADMVVSGRSPLPTEVAPRGALLSASAASANARSPFGDVVRPRERPAFAVRPEIAMWDTTILAFAGASRTAYAAVPRDALPRFLFLLDGGALDGVVSLYLASAPAGRTITSWNDAVTAGLYDAVAPGRSLLAPEIGDVVVTASASATRAGKPETPRITEIPTTETPRTVERPGIPVTWLVGIGVALALLVGTIAVFASRPSTTPPPPPIATEAPQRAAAAPTVSPIRATFVQAEFATHYSVSVQDDPANGPVSYAWSLQPPVTDPNCKLFTQDAAGNSATWLHGDQHGCDHRTQTAVGHPGVVTVTVTDKVWICTATYNGTETGIGPAPQPCTRR